MAELSLTSLQNQVNGKANSSHTHDASQITGTITVGSINSNLSYNGTIEGNTLNAADGSQNVVAFNGQSTRASVWWANKGIPQFAIDSNPGGGASLWANNGTTWNTKLTIASDGSVTYNGNDIATVNQIPTSLPANGGTSTTAYNIPTSDVGGNIWIA